MTQPPKFYTTPAGVYTVLECPVDAHLNGPSLKGAIVHRIDKRYDSMTVCGKQIKVSGTMKQGWVYPMVAGIYQTVTCSDCIRFMEGEESQ
jgi:hypothetical protein